jgi:hypothetical protein
MKLETQIEAIKDHLVGGQTITSLQALRLYGCFRLAARIYDLRQKGYNIEVKMITTKKGKRIARYKYNPQKLLL